MTIDVYTSTGSKKGTATLPKAMFEASVNEGLMHQAVVRQQSNARTTVAHVKSRGEVRGSTRKLFRQKGTGRARRGSVRSPLLRGGAKAFGPRNVANYVKDMPKKMRRAALFSCLSAQANNNAIIGLEKYEGDAKTKTMNELLKKLPVELGRKILIVMPERNEAASFSARNIPNVKVVTAAYLNPVDVLGAKHIIFLVDAIKKAEEVFVKKETEKTEESKESEAKSSVSSASSASSESSKPSKPKE